MKRLIALTYIFIVIFFMSGCSSIDNTSSKPSIATSLSRSSNVEQDMRRSLPADILPRLESAYNSQDLYAIAECFDPAMVEVTFGFIEIFGLKSSALRQILPFFSKALGETGYIDDEQMGVVKLSEVSTALNGDKAILIYNVNLTLHDGTTKDIEETVETILVADTWYISPYQIPARGSDGGVTGILPVQFEGELYECGGAYEHGDCGFMDMDNNIIISKQYQETRGFVNEYAAVKSNNTWGFIDKANRIVVDFKYQDCGDYSDGLFPVKKNGYWGFINEKNETLIDFVFSDIYGNFANERIVVQVNEAYGIIDTSGNYIMPLTTEYRSVFALNDRFVIFSSNRKYDRITQVIDLISGKVLFGDLHHTPFTYIGHKAIFSHKIEGGQPSVISPVILNSDGTEIYVAELVRTALPDAKIVDIQFKCDNWYTQARIGYQEHVIDNDWIPIQAEAPKHAGLFSNLINSKGEFLLNEWTPCSSHTFIPLNQNFFAISYPHYPNDYSYLLQIFNIHGQLIFESLDASSVEIIEKSEFAIIHRSNESIIMNLNNPLETYTFDSGTSLNDNNYGNTVIVSDGIFYGLFINDRLAYDIEYTNIYVRDGEYYTLERGADTTTIHIARSGKIYKHS